MLELMLTVLVMLPFFAVSRKLVFASWNVNGIRALLKYDPHLTTFKSLRTEHNVDILCIQETRIQESHQNAIDDTLKSICDVKNIFWSSSRTRKGYSGVATIYLSDISLNAKEVVSYGIGEETGDLEGRTIVVEAEDHTLINVYTPNSGEGLKRLDYRINTWDIAMREYINNLKQRRPGIPVIVAGDLNVAHTYLDYYNPHERWTRKQAGTTPEEQLSFTENILSLGLKDSYRTVHPTRRQYSYFSARKGAQGRDNHEGYRIDYILSDAPSLASWKPFVEEKIIHPYSDHCPVGCEIEL